MSGHGQGHGHGGHGHGRGHGHDHGHGPHGPGHAHGGAHGRDRHGNPEDLEAYLARLESPERAEWQKPDEVIAALRLRPGMVACDVGAGPGYFALRLARAVGPEGRVHGVDVEPRMIDLLARRAREQGLANVHPRLVGEGEAPVPPEPCDVVLVVNAFHHFPDGAGTLRALGGALRPGGRLVVLDFHPGELPVGPPPEHKVTKGAFLEAATRAGLAPVEELHLLPYQWFVALAPAAR